MFIKTQSFVDMAARSSSSQMKSPFDVLSPVNRLKPIGLEKNFKNIIDNLKEK